MRTKCFMAFGLLIVFLGGFWLGSKGGLVVHAAPDNIIPQNFGHCVGGVVANGISGLIFDADDGTVRIVNISNGKVTVFPRQ